MAALDPVADLERRLDRGVGQDVACHAECDPHVVARARFLADHPATVGKRIALALIEKRRAPLQARRDLRARAARGPAALRRSGRVRAPVRRRSSVRRSSGRARGRRSLRHARALATMLEREPRSHGGRALARHVAACRHDLGSAAPPASRSSASHRALDAEFLASTILAVCGTVVVVCTSANDQTACGDACSGEVLRVPEPARVEAFFVRHARFMPRPCALTCVAKLPEHKRSGAGATVAHHKRATTI